MDLWILEHHMSVLIRQVDPYASPIRCLNNLFAVQIMVLSMILPGYLFIIKVIWPLGLSRYGLIVGLVRDFLASLVMSWVVTLS